jgi:predicted dehydrogenase
MLRAAVIGCGAIGGPLPRPSHPDVGVATHVDAYRACPGTELVAACDSDRARAERAGVRAYTEVAEMLAAEAPAIVSVATPDTTHAEVVAACLRSDSVRAVLAEKPLAADATAAAELVALARARETVLACHYTRRFAPAYRRLAEELRAGALGRLQHVSGAYVKGLKHNGTHWLDLLRMLAGDPLAVRGWDRLKEGGDDPTLDAELALPGDVGARLVGLDAGAFTAFELELVGTRGRVRIVEDGHVIERWTVGDDPREPGYRTLVAAGRTTAALRDGTLHAVADVAAGVRTGAEPACHGGDGVAALELAEAIAASACNGGETRPTARGYSGEHDRHAGGGSDRAG